MYGRITITKKGQEIQKLAKEKNVETIDRLTPEMLKTESYKDKEFREYDQDKKSMYYNYKGSLVVIFFKPEYNLWI